MSEPVGVATDITGARVSLPGWLRISLRFAQQRPLGAAGAVIVLGMALAALLADIIAPADPWATNYALMFQRPSSQFWLGTDSFGRDILSRIIYGSRTALLLRVPSSLCGAPLGARLR